MNSEDRIKAKMRKLLELVRQGVGGERENAQSMLEKLLKKHDLTLEDLDSEKAEVGLYEFAFNDKLEKKLLTAVMHFVLQAKTIMVRNDHKNSKKICIQVTKAQKLEIDLAYGVYREVFKKEQQNLFLAFIHKNHIFGPDENDDKENDTPSKLTKEDLMSIAFMMQGMRTTHVNKSLPFVAQHKN